MDPPSTEIRDLACAETWLRVSWRDGHESTYPSIWLLEACSCRACGSSETAVRHVRLTDKPARPVLVSAALQDGNVALDWGSGHVSRFDPGWLRAHCLSDPERRRRKPAPVIWSAESLDPLPYMDYAAVAGDPARHLAFLEALRDLGFVILKEVPTARARTEEVAGLVGKLRLRKGQSTAPGWTKMRDVSADVEEWLVK